MHLSTQIPVNASPETLWAIISDIEHATERISGIEKVEVLEKPESGLLGLKWNLQLYPLLLILTYHFHKK